jgi:hypothetical protein
MYHSKTLRGEVHGSCATTRLEWVWSCTGCQPLVKDSSRRPRGAGRTGSAATPALATRSARPRPCWQRRPGRPVLSPAGRCGGWVSIRKAWWPPWGRWGERIGWSRLATAAGAGRAGSRRHRCRWTQPWLGRHAQGGGLPSTSSPMLDRETRPGWPSLRAWALGDHCRIDRSGQRGPDSNPWLARRKPDRPGLDLPAALPVGVARHRAQAGRPTRANVRSTASRTAPTSAGLGWGGRRPGWDGGPGPGRRRPCRPPGLGSLPGAGPSRAESSARQG